VNLMERAKLLGLDAEVRNRMERPEQSRVQPTVWSLLAQVPPTDLETIERIQELDPIEKPDDALTLKGGPVGGLAFIACWGAPPQRRTH
jgi:hypothetical protein